MNLASNSYETLQPELNCRIRNYELTSNADVDKLYRRPCSTQTGISRLTQEFCEGVFAGQTVCNCTGP